MAAEMSVSKAKSEAGAKGRMARRVAGVVAAGVVAAAGTLVGAGSASAAYDPVTHTIWNDEPLYKGWHVDAGDTRLIMQDDGNLVLYRWFNDPVMRQAKWASNTVGCGEKTVMQTDGNLVVYGQNGRVCYARNEFKGSYANGCLTVEDRAGLSIYFTNDPCNVAAASRGGIRIVPRTSDAY
ncbi:hypothetical protein ACFWJT_00135 [Streptomyces sp. NPDC127069]|uniref:hypothetical protein n=1 Tax=Streptomyces sp. NPDC127069 TaxID=3347128 RepID=UPI0036604EBC